MITVMITIAHVLMLFFQLYSYGDRYYVLLLQLLHLRLNITSLVLIVLNEIYRQEHNQSKNSNRLCHIVEYSGIFFKKSSLMYRLGFGCRRRDRTLLNTLVRIKQLLIDIICLYSYFKVSYCQNNKQIAQTASIKLVLSYYITTFSAFISFTSSTKVRSTTRCDFYNPSTIMNSATVNIDYW